MKEKLKQMEINNLHNLIIVLTDKCVGLARQAEKYKVQAESLEEQNHFLHNRSNQLFKILLDSGFTHEQIEEQME